MAKVASASADAAAAQPQHKKHRREGAGVRKRIWEKKKLKLLAKRLERQAEEKRTAAPERVQGTGAKKSRGRNRNGNRERKAPIPMLLTECAIHGPAAAACVDLQPADKSLPPQLDKPGKPCPAVPPCPVSPQRAPHASVPSAIRPSLPAFAPPQWELINQPDELERKLQPLLHEPCVGIDIEWRPTFQAGQPRNPVALLQLSSMSRILLVPVPSARRVPGPHP